MQGACVLRALHYISGINPDTIQRACTTFNWTPERNMTDSDIYYATCILHIRLKHIPKRKYNCTIKKFLQINKTGLYLVRTHNHLLVIDNGIMIDLYFNKTEGIYRKILFAMEVIL